MNNDFWQGFEKRAGLLGTIVHGGQHAVSGVSSAVRGAQQAAQRGITGVKSAVRGVVKGTKQEVGSASRLARSETDRAYRQKLIQEKVQQNRASRPELALSRKEQAAYRNMTPQDKYKATRSESRRAKREGTGTRSIPEMIQNKPAPAAPVAQTTQPQGKKPLLGWGAKAGLGAAALAVPTAAAYTAGAAQGMNTYYDQQQQPQ